MSKKKFCNSFSSEKPHIVHNVFKYDDGSVVYFDFCFSSFELAQAFISLLDLADIKGCSGKKCCSIHE